MITSLMILSLKDKPETLKTTKSGVKTLMKKEYENVEVIDSENKKQTFSYGEFQTFFDKI